ncbi:MAG: hypothetical protein KA797_07945 [Chitinophagales bacterium]|nr:hypothetical protein [Chitinophagales bacterium]
MNIIIPMAGWGSRLRPHTLTVPKPMLPVAGKSIVEHLIDNLLPVCPEKVNNIAFIIREEFGPEIEQELAKIAHKHNVKHSIHYQDQPLGTAHAIACAKEYLKGNAIIAFADTVFKADFKIDTSKDGVIWVQKIDDPSSFGVVKLNEQNEIIDFVEKPKDFVSDLAIIGVYYFKHGENLRAEIEYLIDNDIKEKGEYQLTNALENLKQKGAKFIPGQVIEWLDCGNKEATIYSNQRILEFLREKKESLRANTCILENSIIIEPCYIGEDSIIVNSVVGPHVSIGKGTKIHDARIANSIIQNHTSIKNIVITDSMIGSKVVIDVKANDLSLGDYVSLK